MPLQIIRQDITKMCVDAIVNTTNAEMVGYSGVDLAVHTAAGSDFDAECSKLAPLGLGNAKITGGYALPCKYVIHTSGPTWHGGLVGESIILRSCYIESLKLAVKHGCSSVAFPLISSGAYGYPKDQVLKFAVQTITEFLLENELTVYICVFDKESYSFSQKLFYEIKAFINDEYADSHIGKLQSVCHAWKNIDHVSFCKSRKAPDIAMSEQSPTAAHKRIRRIKDAQKSQESSRTGEVGKSLREYMKQMDRSFGEMLFDLIDASGMSDVECYKKANVDKRTFSKIKSNKDYRPSKQTAIAFAISLKLDIDTTQALLATAGLTLSQSNVFDKIIRYFIYNGNYDIFEINEALFDNYSEVIHDRVDISEIKPMTEADYRVDGMTALLDAIGGAIHHIGNVHKYARSEDIPEHTVFVITTDGMENASRYYSAAQIKAKIKRQTEKYGWEFIFLAANIDAVATAENIGIRRERAANYRQTDIGIKASYYAMSEAIMSVRNNKADSMRINEYMEKYEKDGKRS